MKPMNMLFLMSDEHTYKAMGCYGHPFVKTPRLDALAAEGVRFTNAYTNCPICMPARASFATGRYVHEIGNWDNAFPYDGRVPGWGVRLQAAGHRVVSIGKLHFRHEDDPTGFSEQIKPMHAVNGIGDVLGAVRDKLPERRSSQKVAARIGPGESGYTKYDREIARTAAEWLEAEAQKPAGKPWVLFVSFVCPHFPLIAPPEFYEMYPADEMPLPKLHPLDRDACHPWLREMLTCQIQDRFFTDETRRIAIASYYGLCSFLDDNVGRVLDALRRTGLDACTRVVYASDHGENLGVRDSWGKSNMYEEAVGIPLLLAGPDLPRGKVVATPVSLVDAYPTIMECVGVPPNEEERGLPGASWWPIAARADDPERAVFSEYHAAGAITGAFMIRKGRYKYIYYVGFPPELFDLEADPEELNDLAGKPGCADILREFEALLRTICDPEEVDRRAKKDQSELVERHGGREAVIAKGSYGGTPPPGEQASYM